MPVRIYALAKEFKLDSKVIAEICTKIGITGKGSALASLSEEEAEKVRAYHKGGSERTPAMQVSVAGKAETSEPAILKSHAAPSAARAAALLTRGGTFKSSKTSAKKPLAAKAPEQASGATPLRREDYIAPGGVQGEVKRLGEKTHKPDSEPKDSKTKERPRKDDETALVEKSGPSIKLVPMPTVKQPKKKSGPSEPAAQKPDIKLPADAIRASKTGSKPLSEHLRKHELKRKLEAKTETTETEQPPSLPEDLAVAPPVPMESPGRNRTRRSGRPVETAEDTSRRKSLLGGREQRQLKRKRTGNRKRGKEDEGEGWRRPMKIKHTGTNTAAPRKGNVTIELPCSVRSFSESLGLPVAQVLRKMMDLVGTLSNINATLDAELAELLAVELGVDIDFKHKVDLEDQLLRAITDQEDTPDQLKPRPPVVTFLGHVDHGKTSLLDKIIGIDVVSSESGGITQHIRAYQIEKNGKRISFVDTPGHEAFTEMRARGANVTDIAVLVIAADDGVMPQTEEAFSHARAADVPIVVALNKMDLPGANPQRVLEQLSANELLPAEWGGDVEVIKTSAQTGDGIDQLLDTLLTVAEIHDYQANPDRAAYGTCLESSLHEGRGVVAKIIVQKGRLSIGDVIVCGSAYGRIKTIEDTLQPAVTHQEAGPSMPVNITGLGSPPDSGEHFYVLDDIVSAREIAQRRHDQSRESSLSSTPVHVTLENLFDTLGQEKVPTLNLILRADTRGSIDAIKKELLKLEHPEVKIKILQATVGGISEADVHLADASDAVIIGFCIVPDEAARMLADNRGIQIRRYEVIYKITEDLKAALEGMLKPEKRELDLGRVLVQRTFKVGRVGTIAGCKVMHGTVERNSRAKVIRENQIIGQYRLDSLRREKDDVKEVRQGFECGIKLSGFNDIKEGDVFEIYKIEEVTRTLT